MELTINLHLGPRLRTNGALHLFLVYALLAWTGKKLVLTFESSYFHKFSYVTVYYSFIPLQLIACHIHLACTGSVMEAITHTILTKRRF